jgi:vancomycin resistance protein VanW
MKIKPSDWSDVQGALRHCDRFLRAKLRPVLGPASRRLLREAQWFSVRSEFSTLRTSTPLPFVVATHHTPLMRPLLRLDERLQLNKIVNLRIASALLDGLVLAPGQRLSFWKLVRKPTYRRGFKDGLVLKQGQLSSGVGGGLCQMTNLLYWMTLHTPLTVAERWRHSYDVFPDANRTQPFGSGATCSWPVLDLQIVNHTSATYRLSLAVEANDLRGAWTSSIPRAKRYVIEERSHLVTHDGPATYTRHNELWRIETDEETGERFEEFLVSNEAKLMYDPFLPPAPEERGAGGR